MGWMFQLDRLLDDMNRIRERQQRPCLTWREVAALVGLEYKSLVNLASNSTLRRTNTRFLEALCRFFCCQPSDLMVLEPEPERREPDHAEIDRLLEEIRLGQRPRAFFHVLQLYNEEAEHQWRVRREQARAAGAAQVTPVHRQPEQVVRRRRARFRRR